MNRKPRIIKECKICKKEMSLMPSRVRKTTVCSRECNFTDIRSRKNRLGSKLTPEHKEILRQAHLGKPTWNKGLKGYRAGLGTRQGIMPKGELHWSYKIDRTTLKQSEYKWQDYRYRCWSLGVKNRDNWKCRITNNDCKGRLESHHILDWKNFPELRYEINNGITLCHAHHPQGRENEAKLSPYLQSLVAEGN